MYTIAKKITEARITRGLNQSELARMLKVTPQAVQKWEQGQSFPKGKRLVALANALQVSVDELFKFPEASDYPELEKPARQFVAHNIEMKGVQKVPLISWVTAGDLEEVSDVFLPGHADEWIRVYDKNVSSSTFALKVVGDSMEAPSGTSFSDGDVLICDPETAANAGDFVIAKDVLTQRATFKKLTTDGSRWYLEPLNPKYALIPIDKEDLRIIAKVIQRIKISNF